MSPRLSLLLALALAAAGCVSKAAKAPAPAEERPITFPHSTHVDSGVECKECHSGIEKASRLEPGQIHLAFPAKSDLCSGCHEKIPAAPKVAFQPSVNFNHAFHLPLVKNECARCHKKLPEPGMTQDPVPAMSTCTGCHNHQKDYAQARCTPSSVPRPKRSNWQRVLPVTHGSPAEAPLIRLNSPDGSCQAKKRSQARRTGASAAVKPNCDKGAKLRSAQSWCSHSIASLALAVVRPVSQCATSS